MQRWVPDAQLGWLAKAGDVEGVIVSKYQNYYVLDNGKQIAKDEPTLIFKADWVNEEKIAPYVALLKEYVDKSGQTSERIKNKDLVGVLVQKGANVGDAYSAIYEWREGDRKKIAPLAVAAGAIARGVIGGLARGAARGAGSALTSDGEEDAAKSEIAKDVIGDMLHDLNMRGKTNITREDAKQFLLSSGYAESDIDRLMSELFGKLDSINLAKFDYEVWDSIQTDISGLADKKRKALASGDKVGAEKYERAMRQRERDLERMEQEENKSHDTQEGALKEARKIANYPIEKIKQELLQSGYERGDIEYALKHLFDHVVQVKYNEGELNKIISEMEKSYDNPYVALREYLGRTSEPSLEDFVNYATGKGINREVARQFYSSMERAGIKPTAQIYREKNDIAKSVEEWFQYGGRKDSEANAHLGNTPEFDKMINELESSGLGIYEQDIIARSLSSIPASARVFIRDWYKKNVPVIKGVGDVAREIAVTTGNQSIGRRVLYKKPVPKRPKKMKVPKQATKDIGILETGQKLIKQTNVEALQYYNKLAVWERAEYLNQMGFNGDILSKASYEKLPENVQVVIDKMQEVKKPLGVDATHSSYGGKEQESYFCRYCGKIFDKYHEYDAHLESEHRSGKADVDLAIHSMFEENPNISSHEALARLVSMGINPNKAQEAIYRMFNRSSE